MVISMKVKKAVIPAGGWGTRDLPATKAMPKELLPIVDKPAIQYNVEEAVKSGITDICIILSPDKDIVKKHFSTNKRLERHLKNGGKKYEQKLEEVQKISRMANFTYVIQEKAMGLGHAVYLAKDFVNGESFAVLYGDDVIIGDIPCCKQVCNAYEKYGLGTVAIKEVSDEFIVKYSSMKCKNIKDNVYSITDMKEKPGLEDKFSNFSILGRCVLPFEIFDILESIPKGQGGEYQLTDAMALLAREKGMIGIDFLGSRYDMGSKIGILEAALEVGLKHPEVKDDLEKLITKLAQKINS